MIKDLKDFQVFLKLCRKAAVTEINMEGISIKFKPAPKQPGAVEDASEEPETDELTPEQLAFYSVGGPPA